MEFVGLTILRAQSEEEFRAALAAAPEVVLSDASLPLFSCVRALELLAEQGAAAPPLLVVSGSIPPATAAELTALGAAAIVSKDDLQALAPAIRSILSRGRRPAR